MADVILGGTVYKNVNAVKLDTTDGDTVLFSANSGGEYDEGYDDGHAAGYEEGRSFGHDEGYDKGHEDGYEEGRSFGHDEGYEAGRVDGYDQGVSEGREINYNEGYEAGHSAGYDEGYNEGVAVGEGQYDAGYADGTYDGYQEGYQVGYDEGIAEGEGKYNEGYDSGYADGETAGEKSMYDLFWDVYQNNGSRTDYSTAFGGEGWTDEVFTPKYDINSANSYMMFRMSNITDLGAAIQNSGRKLTMSDGRLEYTFQACKKLENVDGIEFTNPLTNVTYGFSFCTQLKRIQTLPISESANSLSFTNIPLLEDISFAGIIPVSISFAHSKNLTTTSVQSIIDHLKDLSGQTAQTLTLHADVVARMTDEQRASITAKNWTLVY